MSDNNDSSTILDDLVTKRNNSEQQPEKKKLSCSDRSVINAANEILNSLEQSHCADLGLHLYSSYLLKKLLFKANEKKYMFEIDQFFKTQIKENWVSWPNPNTIIDPQTDKLYEDGVEDGISFNLKPGEVSANAMIHSSQMLRREMDSYWQQCLSESAKSSNNFLDIDEIVLPTLISNKIFTKLDHFFEGLHNNVAKQKNIEIDQSVSNGQLVISQVDTIDETKENKHISFMFHDIIARGCDMGEDMTEIYMKSLELFNDIPGTFHKNQFKLPKQVLKKYRPAISANRNMDGIFKSSRDDFLLIEQLLKDKRITAKEKAKLRLSNKKDLELGINKKIFFKVKGLEPHETMGNNIYGFEDARVKIPRNK